MNAILVESTSETKYTMTKIQHETKGMNYNNKQVGNFFSYNKINTKNDASICMISEIISANTAQTYKTTLFGNNFEKREVFASCMDLNFIKLKEEHLLALEFIKPTEGKIYCWGNLVIKDIKIPYKHDMDYKAGDYGYVAYFSETESFLYTDENIRDIGVRLPFIHCFQNFIKHHSINLEVQIDHILSKSKL